MYTSADRLPRTTMATRTLDGPRAAPANFISRRVGDGGGPLNRRRRRHRRRHRRYTSLAYRVVGLVG